jgi:hypothetical protein
MLELDITLEENEISIDNKSSSDANHENQIPTENNNDKKDLNEENIDETSDNSEDNDVDSIESIPFLAEPAKKKSTRTKKATA